MDSTRVSSHGLLLLHRRGNAKVQLTRQLARPTKVRSDGVNG